MNIQISSKCIGCGICAEICPAYIISMENNIPVLNSQNCIKCGHCEAVCPTNAFTNNLLNHDNVIELDKNPVLDSKTAEIFLRSRRSTRCFKDDIVSKEETEKLINIGRYAQTGSNSQGVSYIVVSSKDTMEKLRAATMDFYKNQDNNFSQKLYENFSKSKHDILFRGAPMMILALTPKNIPYLLNNAKYSLTYIELFAPTLNLGTCWAGFFEGYTSKNDDSLHSILNIPDDLLVSGVLLFGYKKYNYHRLTERNKLSLEWR